MLRWCIEQQMPLQITTTVTHHVVGVEYGEDFEKVKAVLQRIIKFQILIILKNTGSMIFWELFRKHCGY